ncbi:MAG TPA: DUF6029 family protein, partial [Candidatus Eisenbacteria bacterium]
RKDGVESFEDLFRVDASWRRWTIGARFHAIEGSEAPGSEEIDQRYLQYVDDHLELLGGNFYETWGRGLVLRAYETRTATVGRLDRSVALDRDIDGFRARARYGRLFGTALSGSPLLAPLSGEPASDGAGVRLDTMRGARAGILAPGGLTATGGYLRINTIDPGAPDPESAERIRDEYLTGEADFVRGPVVAHLSGARRHADELLLPEDGRAWYGSASASVSTFGASFEFKDYERFVSPYNEPPTLVKTQSWTLLNRGTHLSNPDDEVGQQAALEWSPGPEDGVSLNHSRADNHDRDEIFEYRQWTLEARLRTGADDSGPRFKAIADWERDRIKGITDRWTAGGDMEIGFGDIRSIATVFEHQVTDFEFADQQRLSLLTLEYQEAPWLTVAFQGEKAAEPEEGRDTWASATVNLSWSGRHNLNIFVGRRPTGYLCTGGYCFLAPAFDGIALRLISLFGD